jgi:deoxyribodipyrimidine photolyase-related protein
MATTNFFKHHKKLKNSWYDGTTGIVPLDYMLKIVLSMAGHVHIERLMVVANIMNLSNIEPKLVYRSFMEMYVDIPQIGVMMAPNVYGMGLFSDGGIFATKPYICCLELFIKNE